MSYTPCGCNVNIYGPSIAGKCSGSSYLMFMTIVESLLRYTCDVSDPCGRIVPRTIPDSEYDFVIIGSGTGGSTVAGRLAQTAQWKILLLEAGDDEPIGTQVPSFSRNYLETSIDWDFKTEPEPVACQGFEGKRCSWPRGKVLGGTSVINGMMFIRGTPKDHQRWVDAGNTDWSYEKVLPAFKSIEDNKNIGSLVNPNHHGKGGPLTIERFQNQPSVAWDILRAGQQIGYNISSDLSGDDINGFAVAQMNARNGVRLSLAKAFVRPHRNNPNFHVMLNSTVTKIVVARKENTKYASAVEFVYKNRSFAVKVNKEVIVCAGAVQTPQVLLLSGIGGKDVLQSVGIKQVHDLPAVGKGLQNHVAFQLNASLNILDLNELNWISLTEYIEKRSGPMSSTGMAQVTARINSQYSTPDDPDIQFYFFGFNADCASTGIVGAPNDPKKPVSRKTINIYPVNLHIKSKGYISLHSSDPFAAPKIIANYLTDEQDINGLRAGIRIAQKLIQAPILQKYRPRLENTTYKPCDTKFRWDSDDYWNCAIKYKTGHENHQGSSCKMGKESDPESCVNQKLQLHGIENIRIMDASVFPTLPSANPQASIVMVAERGAQFIKEKYLKKDFR